MSDPTNNPWRYVLADTTIGENEIERVTAVLKSGWLTQGPLCQEFEQRFGDVIGSPGEHNKVVSSCTAGLHLGLAALGIGAGDEVIVPSLSFVASANCVRYVGATPVFADVIGRDDLTIDPHDIEAKIGPRTRAIICVHFAGYAAKLPELVALCEKHELFLIEDVAHAPGASLDGRGLGTWGDVGCFSFFSNKNLAMGEGGMVACRSAELAEKIGRMRSHGMTSLTLDRHKGHAFSYDVIDPGFNFRISEVAAAIGLGQLDRLIDDNGRRAVLSGYYRQCFADHDAIEVPFANAQGTPAYHIMPVILDDKIDRGELMAELKRRGVQTSIHYPPIHLFSDFKRCFGTTEGMLPQTEAIAAHEITLPLHPNLSTADIDAIVHEIDEAISLVT